MNLYDQKYNWKLLLLVAGLTIVLVSVWYNNMLSKELATEEEKKIQLWANAYRNLNNAEENTDIGFLFEVIQNNTTVPVILTDDKDSIFFWRNIDSVKAMQPNYLFNLLNEMRKSKPPIVIEITPGDYSYIYYKESYPLVKLKFYPVIQLGIIGIFLIVSYIAFSNSRNAEQNRIWVGMAKETAHQLGTPISSLAAWVEYLREYKTINDASVNEIEKDVARLEQITDRFSKIGSSPVLELQNIVPSLQKNMDYISKRASQQVEFSLKTSERLMAYFNPPLFDWVMENLLKNALDAMDGKGKIIIAAEEDEKHVFIDVSDSGKGIPKSKFDTVFKPGYSTKKRGWGLGLALVKRIVEKYHKGKIFVKHSEPGKGTTFRIVLKRKH